MMILGIKFSAKFRSLLTTKTRDVNSYFDSLIPQMASRFPWERPIDF